MDILLNQIQEAFDHVCDETDLVIYPEFILPEDNDYDYNFSRFACSVAFNTSSFTCPNVEIVAPPGFTVSEIFRNRDDGILSIVYLDTNRSTAIVAFSGTMNYNEFITDLKFHQVAPKYLNGYEDGMLIHQGFNNIYQSIRDLIWDWYENNKSSFTNLIFIGHSLGGALASLATFDFSVTDRRLINYTFGCPRWGNDVMAQKFNSLDLNSYRINNTEDIIPQVPLSVFKTIYYEHVANNIPFTINLNSLFKNHNLAYLKYYDYLQ